MSKRFIEQESIRAGQQRAYGDSIYESILTFSVPEGQAWASKWPTTADQVKPFVKLLVHDFYEGDPKDMWHTPKLTKLEQVSTSPNKWHVIVTQIYLD